MTTDKDNLALVSRIYNDGHLPTSEYGQTKITTMWMLRQKAEARNEVRQPRHNYNPFARKA